MFEAPRHIRPAGIAPSDFAAGAFPQSRIDFHRFWSAVWQGRTTIATATAAVFILAMTFTALVPHEYTAATQLLIDPSDLRTVGNETAAAQGSDAAVLQVESQVRVLNSDAVLRRVVDAENLDRDPEFVHGPSLLAVLFGGSTMPVDPKLAALAELGRQIKVKRADRTYVVEVDVSSRDPMKSARIANAITQSYLTQQTELRADSARQVSQTLSARLQELQDRVRDAEDRAEAYKASHNIVDANGQHVSDQQLAEMTRLLELARYHVAETKARYEQVARLQQSKDENGAFAEAVQSPTISALRGQYAEIMRREAEQMTTLGPRHPAVIDIQAQAERLRGMIADEINRAAQAARNDYASAQANAQTLEDNLEALKHSSVDTSEAMVGLRELERDVQASRSVYEAFLARARESGEQEQLDTKNIHVLSKADLPLTRSWPPPTPLMALASLIVGIAAGTGLVLMRAPAIEGSPPWSPIATGVGAKSRLWPARPPRIPVLARLPAADVSYSLGAIGDPSSPFTRQIGQVYEELRSSHTKPGNPAILIVAADADEDLASVALSLAAFAAATQRVLLIDADLDRRTLAAIDAGHSDAGLVDVALGRRHLADVVTVDRETNVSLLPFVSPNSRRDRRIADSDIRRAFDLTRRYDAVVVAAVNDGDPGLRFFAGVVDHILLVGRVNDGDQRNFEPFVARLGADARKVRGAILIAAA